jgi:hypothetical protein
MNTIIQKAPGNVISYVSGLLLVVRGLETLKSG